MHLTENCFELILNTSQGFQGAEAVNQASFPYPTAASGCVEVVHKVADLH